MGAIKIDLKKALILSIIMSLSGMSSAHANESKEQAHSQLSVASCSHVPYGKDTSPHQRNHILPPNNSGATIVDLGLYVVEVTKISEADNNFKLEAYLDLVWCDPRTAFDAEAEEIPRKVYIGKAADHLKEKIWWPDVNIVNEDGAPEIEDEEIIILPDGTVEYQEKFNVTVQSPFDLTRFPFDRQRLEVEIESFAWSEKDLVFHEETDRIGFSDHFEIPEWHTVSVETTIRSVKEIRDRDKFSEFIMNIVVERRSAFYIFKVFIPMIFLVVVSWVVFWINIRELETRMAVSFGGIFSVIAFQLFVSDKLPSVSYLTAMDAMLLLSFVFTSLTAFENVYNYVLTERGRGAQAIKMDNGCKRYFPLAYFGLLTVLFLTYYFVL